jgi:nitroreductase
MQTKPVTNDTLLNQLKWRYATKKFDPKRKISERDWRTLEETLVLTPSSYGLQPWRFVVVTNPLIREQLVHASWGQRQVADASHLVVFAIKKDLSTADVDRYLKHIANVRGVPLDSLAGFRGMMLDFVTQPKSEFDINDWAARQVYIALGNFIAAASLLAIDTCPMEGFEPARYDEILGLDKQGYSAVVLCPAGYRAADDPYAAQPKVRFPLNEIISRVE